jgi:hypothetical protein
MPYLWKRWGEGVALSWRDGGALIAGVKDEHLDWFGVHLLSHPEGEDLMLKDTDGVELVVPAEDVVSFALAFMKVGFGR